MFIWFFSIFIIIISYKVLYNKKNFCVFSGIVLFLLLAFRSVDMGLSDTSGIYYTIFNYTESHDIKDVLLNTSLNGSAFNGKLFFLLTDIIGLFTDNYHLYLAIIALPTIIVIINFIYKYSENVLVSIIVFISLYYLYAFYLLRQMFAIIFVILSYKYLCERKFFKFGILILLACCIHQSAIVFLIAYPFCNLNKFGKKNYIYIIGALIISYVLPSIIMKIIELTGVVNIKYITEYHIYSTSGTSMFGLLVTVTILVFSHLYYKKSEQNYENDLLYNLSTLGSIVFAFSNVVTEFYRLSVYFSFFNVILLSNSLSKEKKKKLKTIYSLLIILIMLVYFFARSLYNNNCVEYKTFWRDFI